jgi:hypothetical protein
MPLYTFIHNLLNVLVQTANGMGLQKKIVGKRNRATTTEDYNRKRQLVLQRFAKYVHGTLTTVQQSFVVTSHNPSMNPVIHLNPGSSLDTNARQ